MSFIKKLRNKWAAYSNKLRFLLLSVGFCIKRNEEYKFTLVDDSLYTSTPIKLDNSRIQIQYKSFNLASNARIFEINEPHYLLLLHEDNLAHFFHDVFFPVYVHWRQKQHKVVASISNNQFLKDFLISTFGVDQVIFADRSAIYKFKDLLLTPEGRDLRTFTDYINICREIKMKCFSSCKVSEVRNQHLLYGRNELSRKNLLDIDEVFLQSHNIKKLSLATRPFKEVVTALAQAKTFTYMVGAGVFYLLFLDSDVKVLEINPHQNNSWAQMFGMADLCEFEAYVSDKIELSTDPAQGNPMLDSHVYFDEEIKKLMIKLTSN